MKFLEIISLLLYQFNVYMWKFVEENGKTDGEIRSISLSQRKGKRLELFGNKTM
jgi:hypothetical protein